LYTGLTVHSYYLTVLILDITTKPIYSEYENRLTSLKSKLEKIANSTFQVKSFNSRIEDPADSTYQRRTISKRRLKVRPNFQEDLESEDAAAFNRNLTDSRCESFQAFA